MLTTNLSECQALLESLMLSVTIILMVEDIPVIILLDVLLYALILHLLSIYEQSFPDISNSVFHLHCLSVSQTVFLQLL